MECPKIIALEKFVKSITLPPEPCSIGVTQEKLNLSESQIQGPVACATGQPRATRLEDPVLLNRTALLHKQQGRFIQQ